MNDRQVAILGGGLFRPSRVRYENAEEGVAMAYRDMLEDFPELDPREIQFVQSSYFSDHLNQQLCMSWIVQNYIGKHRKGGYRVEAGGSTPLDAIIDAYFLLKSGQYDLTLVLGWEWMSEVDTATTNEFIASASDTDWDFTIMTAPTDVFVGHEVSIDFRETRKGDLMDIYALPVEGQSVPQGSCLHSNPQNTKDLNRDLENTCAFLDKRFGIRKEDVEKRRKA